jgi:hypothetical protein
MRLLWQIAVLVAIAVGGCTVSVGKHPDSEPLNVGTEEQQKSVIAATRAVAKLLDASQFELVWDQSGPMLQAQASRTAFTTSIKAMRNTLGPAGRRKIKGFNFPKVIDGVQGDFGLIGIETDFANAESVEEKFVFQKVGGRWRLAGYWLTKKVKFGANTSNNSFKPNPLRGSA